MSDRSDAWFIDHTGVTALHPVRLDDIDRIAALMLHHLPSGVSVGLVGTLGAGKTRLVQGIAKAAGIDDAEVTSPTFTLLQTHRGKVTIHHLDAYRLAEEDEFLQLGVDELFEDENAWTLVEWADRVRDAMPLDTVWIRILIAEEPATRHIEFADPGGKHTRSISRIEKDFVSDAPLEKSPPSDTNPNDSPS